QADELRERTALLDLAQILVRDMEGRIVLWNQGAETMYGWTAAEATGRSAHELLQTQFPEPPGEIMEKLLAAGRWEGEVVHTRRDGTRATVAAGWILPRRSRATPR